MFIIIVHLQYLKHGTLTQSPMNVIYSCDHCEISLSIKSVIFTVKETFLLGMTWIHQTLQQCITLEISNLI